MTDNDNNDNDGQNRLLSPARAYTARGNNYITGHLPGTIMVKAVVMI